MLDLLNWTKDGRYRSKIVLLLGKKPLLSSELASELDINRASMSRILKQLKEKKIVEFIASGSRTRTYVLTTGGKKLYQFIKDETN